MADEKLHTSQMAPTKEPSSKLPAQVLFKDVGASGTYITEGYIREEDNAVLDGLSGLRIYDMMRRTDAQVYATLLAMEQPIRTTKWTVQPAVNEDGEVDEEDKEIAEFVEEALFRRMDTTWDDFLRQVLTMLPFGFSIFEKVYKPIEDRVYIGKLAMRLARSVERWQTEDGKPGITQTLQNNNYTEKGGIKPYRISIPQEKLLVFSYRREGDNYEGVSVLRSAYKHWKIKDQLYRFDAVRHERASIGIPKITLGAGSTETDREIAISMVKNIRGTEQTGVVLPNPDWVFEFVDLKGNSGTDIYEAIKHHNREISKNILAQFLELGDTQSGSRSLSEDQSGLFLLTLAGVAQQIADTINRFLIPELVKFNFDTDRFPTLEFNKLGDLEYDKWANALKTLADAGILTPDEDLEVFVRESMDLPPMMKKDGMQPQPGMPEEEAPEGEPSPDEVIEVKPVKREPAEKEVQEVKQEAKEQKKEVKASEACYYHEDQEFAEFCSMINNDLIIELQNECATPQDEAVLKKKGLIFNTYEGKAFRPLTFQERRVNLTAIAGALDTFVSIIDGKIKGVTDKMKDDIIVQVRRAVEKNDIKALGNITTKYKGELSQAITDVQKELFEIGKKTASREMEIKTPPTRSEVRGALRVQNDALVDKMAADMETQVKQAVAQETTGQGGSITDLSAAAAVGTATLVLDRILTKQRNAVSTIGSVGALNLGRNSVFQRVPDGIVGFQYSAILDDRTTDHCRSLDGRVVKPFSDEYRKYTPPQHYNCRSMWVPILATDEFQPRVTGIPQSIKPTRDMDNFKDLSAPKGILKDSPAIASIRNEIAEREDKLESLERTGKFPNRQRQHRARIDKLKNSIKGKFVEELKIHLNGGGVKFK